MPIWLKILDGATIEFFFCACGGRSWYPSTSALKLYNYIVSYRIIYRIAYNTLCNINVVDLIVTAQLLIHFLTTLKLNCLFL